MKKLKKFSVILLIILFSVMILSGGCGSSSSHSYLNNRRTSTFSTWTSDTGTATIKSGNNELDTFVKAFGELPAEVLAEYKEQKEVTASITRSVAFLDTENNLFSCIIIVSNDSTWQPIIYDGVKLTSNGENSWSISDGTSLKISSEGLTISGKFQDCEFTTTLKQKTYDTEINLNEILAGTWTFDGSQAGGYSSDDVSVSPEAVSIFFNTDDNVKVNMFYALRSNANSLYQEVISFEGTLTKIKEDVYTFTETNGDESLILVENIDEILIFRNNIFLPLKKVSFNLETAINKNWKAVSGGGYVKIKIENPKNEFEASLCNLLENFSLTLSSGSFSFSKNNNLVTGNISGLFSITNEFLASIGIPLDDIDLSTEINFSADGNFLKYEDSEESDKLVFLSETEAFISMEAYVPGEGEAKFVIRFRAE